MQKNFTRRSLLRHSLAKGCYSFLGIAFLTSCAKHIKQLAELNAPKRKNPFKKPNPIASSYDFDHASKNLEQQEKDQEARRYQSMHTQGSEDLYSDPSESVHSQSHNGSSKRHDKHYLDDVYATPKEIMLIKNISAKIKRLQNYVGYGHFNVLSWQEALSYMQYSPRLHPLDKIELDYVYRLFETDAKKYGFMGEKVNRSIDDKINSKEIAKVPYSGHYLFVEQYEKLFKRLQKDVGKSLILTSGVRGVVKQIHLFLSKTVMVDGNLSLASRSLAPPGYSFHAVGDFDVGKAGLGSLNFTDKFSKTNEFKKLMDLTYIDIRYPVDNNLGVRFEPWHIDGFKRQIKHCQNCG